jgi:hypothetical protein
MRTTKPNATPASAFMASFSAAGRIDPAGPKLCVHCKRNRARWDSIYCSEHCRKQFLDALRETK